MMSDIYCNAAHTKTKFVQKFKFFSSSVPYKQISKLYAFLVRNEMKKKKLSYA